MSAAERHLNLSPLCWEASSDSLLHIKFSSADQITRCLYMHLINETFTPSATMGKPQLPVVPDKTPQASIFQMLCNISSIDFLCEEHNRCNPSKFNQGSKWGLPRSGSLSGQSPPSCRKKKY